MRYFFHLVKGASAYKDTRGLEFSDDERAIARAKKMARERAGDGLWNRWSLLVVDDPSRCPRDEPTVP